MSEKLATFRSLNNGIWGLNITGEVKPGDIVMVKKKDGSTARKKVKKILCINGEDRLCTIDESWQEQKKW